MAKSDRNETENNKKKKHCHSDYILSGHRFRHLVTDVIFLYAASAPNGNNESVIVSHAFFVFISHSFTTFTPVQYMFVF